MLLKAKENVLIYYTRGINYYGFENGAEEKEVITKPVTLAGETLKPGDKIVGFESYNKRTGYKLAYDYMTYRGMYEAFLLFEIYDSKQKAEQKNLFQEKPHWLLAFARITEEDIQVFSSPATSWDIKVRKILRYENL